MVVKIERLVISRRDIVDDYKTMMRMILAVICSFSRVFFYIHDCRNNDSFKVHTKTLQSASIIALMNKKKKKNR